MDFYSVVTEASSIDKPSEKKEKLRIIYDEDVPNRVYIHVHHADKWYQTQVDLEELKRAVSEVERHMSIGSVGPTVDSTVERDVDLSE